MCRRMTRFCRAKHAEYSANAGLHRWQGITSGIEDDNIVEILPRKNELVRPKAANIDLALMTVSTTEPSIRISIKMLAVCEYKKIEPVIVLTKNDLKEDDSFAEIYRKAGFTVILTGEDIHNEQEILSMMQGKVSIVIGNTGVGKSTLLNRLFPDLDLRTAAISNKLGRGRHTTRQVELYPIPGGGYVADSPGFSTVELEQYEPIRKEDCNIASVSLRLFWTSAVLSTALTGGNWMRCHTGC